MNFLQAIAARKPLKIKDLRPGNKRGGYPSTTIGEGVSFPGWTIGSTTETNEAMLPQLHCKRPLEFARHQVIERW
jgi:hypothetical protein